MADVSLAVECYRTSNESSVNVQRRDQLLSEEDVAKIAPSRSGSQRNLEMCVLYRDEDIIVLDKPPGLRTVPGVPTEELKSESRAQVSPSAM